MVLLTGWGQRLIAENDTPPHVDRILSKPPKLAELRAALAELTTVPLQFRQLPGSSLHEHRDHAHGF